MLLTYITYCKIKRAVDLAAGDMLASVEIQASGTSWLKSLYGR